MPKAPNRLFMVIIFAFANYLIGFMGAPIAPMAKSVKRVYGQSLDKITLASSIFSFAGLFTGFSANFLIHKFGIRWATILAVFLYLVGMCVKLGMNQYFYSVHIGEIIAGLGAPFVQNGIGNFANHWYKGKAVKIEFFLENFLIFFFFNKKINFFLIERDMYICVKCDEPFRSDDKFCIPFYICERLFFRL